MTLARLSIWRFKPGRRENALLKIKNVVLPIARKTKGYSGSLHLVDENDQETLVFVTLWSNKSTLEESKSGVFEKALRELKDDIEIRPDVGIYKVDLAEFV